MEKSLAPFFTADRTKRLDSLPLEQRRIVEEEAKASGNPDVFIDNVLVSKWLAQRTGKDDAFVDENLNELVKVYFGESANTSSAYSNIAAHYQEWTNALDEARALAEVQRRAERAKYASQSIAYKVGGTAAESAATFTLGAAEGLSRAVSMGAEKMRAPTKTHIVTGKQIGRAHV